MARTEQESDRRGRDEKRQTCWCCQDQQRACRMAQASTEKLEHTEPAEKERVALVLKVRCWQVCQSRLCQKKKEQSHLSKASDREGRESQGEQEPHYDKRKGIRAGAWRGNSGLHDEGRQDTKRGTASKKPP